MSTRDIESSKAPSKPGKTLPRLPAKEISWVKSILQDGTIFYTTSNPERTQYYLYEKTSEGFVRIAKAQSPTMFQHLICQARTTQIEKKTKRKLK